MSDEIIDNLPVIKTKDDAEIFLIFLMKYRDYFYQLKLNVLDKFFINAGWDGMISAKPFYFRAVVDNGKEFLYHTFHEAIDWIFEYRKWINVLIKSNNFDWPFYKDGKVVRRAIFL